MKPWLTRSSLVIVLVVGILGGAIGERLFGVNLLDRWFPPKVDNNRQVYWEILTEENAIIKVVDAVTPSVVTVSIKTTQVVGFFGAPAERQIEEDIGSGFIIDASDGLIVTNQHVVSDLTAQYQIITATNQQLPVTKIYRDPVNDMAILKVDTNQIDLQPVVLGNSDDLKVGQVVIAIGTALGEFRSTVTTGVISGLGRGINAGSPFGGLSERLDNVIQTDAAINPGNSGGPLLNSSGEVIGVNVAVSAAGQNIGFALPINAVKKAIDSFEATGSFSRPYLGIRYQMISQQTAILNAVPQGAFVVEVVSDSPAEKAGIYDNDIIVKIDGVQLTEEKSLASVVEQKKVGDQLSLEIYRNGETINQVVTLAEL